MKILYRTILKDLILTFILTIAFLNSVLMMEKIIRVSKLLSGIGAGYADMAKIVLYLQPQILMLTIPMALLLSVLLVYGRMNIDSEIVIMKTAGMSFNRISGPVLFLGIICFLINIMVSFFISPKSSIRLRETINEVIVSRSALSLEEGMFNSSFRDITIMVKGKTSPDNLKDVFIYDNRQKEEPKVLMAKEGSFFINEGSNIGLLLNNGYINITKDRNSTEFFFDKYRMTLSINTEPAGPKKSEFTPYELLEKSLDAESLKQKTEFLLAFHRRISLPAICLILSFLGSPLSLIAGKAGRLGGLALGLFTFTIYYIILIYGENTVMAEKMPHYMGAWLATIILGACTFIVFRKASER